MTKITNYKLLNGPTLHIGDVVYKSWNGVCYYLISKFSQRKDKTYVHLVRLQKEITEYDKNWFKNDVVYTPSTDEIIPLDDSYLFHKDDMFGNKGLFYGENNDSFDVNGREDSPITPIGVCIDLKTKPTNFKMKETHKLCVSTFLKEFHRDILCLYMGDEVDDMVMCGIGNKSKKDSEGKVVYEEEISFSFGDGFVDIMDNDVFREMSENVDNYVGLLNIKRIRLSQNQ